jgi:hypothetical protein
MSYRQASYRWAVRALWIVRQALWNTPRSHNTPVAR